MAGSCCGGTTKSELAKVIAPTEKTTEVAKETHAKSECCTDKSASKGEQHSCGC